MEKRNWSNFSSFPQYFSPVIRFSCLGRDQISLRDKRLLEISEVEIARVNCILKQMCYTYIFSVLVIENASCIPATIVKQYLSSKSAPSISAIIVKL